MLAEQLIDTLERCDQAIALNADFAPAHLRRGAVLLKLRRFADALPSFTRAAALEPDFAEAWAGMGRAFGKLHQHKLAIGAFRRALVIAPDTPFLKGRLLQHMLLSCDWADMAPLIEEIERDVQAGKPSARPFAWQAVSTSPRNLQLCAEIFNAANAANPVPRPVPAQARADRRIRIGYVSGELRDHSTAYLRVGVFEQHNRSQFDVIAFDNGWDDGGATRARINQAIDRIIDIRGLSDAETAQLIEAEKIDILLDCNGFNGLHRQGVFALRPAPVQVSFPGYPGTLGADYIDYIIADETVIPPEHRQFYAEQVVQMPDSYQANDRQRPIAERTFTRAELGLPERGFVFCCFNANYKIMPPVLNVWVRIMAAVPGSVLWLLADNAEAVANLRREVSGRGLDLNRLIFADRMAAADHLARHRAADLFLDTLPCNAHATASDALWAGLPVLACLGTTFSGRVAASVLRAVGLPEMVAESMADYESNAITLASNPEALAGVRQKLAEMRRTTALFDTPRYTRSLERAYAEMFSRAQAGEGPSPLYVGA